MRGYLFSELEDICEQVVHEFAEDKEPHITAARLGLPAGVCDKCNEPHGIAAPDFVQSIPSYLFGIAVGQKMAQREHEDG